MELLGAKPFFVSFVCMKRIASLFIAALLFAATVFGQQTNGNLRGRVVDAAGAVIVGANVTVIVAASGVERSAQTNQAGEFSFTNLAPGKYVIRVSAPGFAAYENAEIEVFARRDATVDVALNIAQAEAQVNVGEEEPVNTNPEANASALVLKEEDIEALPDNDEELASAL